ncbi:reverse transcriptase domain-containing protein [Virgibacillus sp. SK37]|uniref:reverse transcriptase domain-containing protein n=1 Tax=Virgibacillus sp. SK37 TaxID=403957 RepID=UPI0004D152A0|nr:reverse transcriptase domain-containing protein [Virgibacillus sp. SK37]AIF44533.1 RNA-directed DNA polymerase [Virgibacillus sp. SK37]
MIHNKKSYQFQSKNYLHFDGKRTYNEKIKDYVTNSVNIHSHSFYPFIRYFTKTEKYYRNEDYPDSRPIKAKKRMIMYASHIDNFIYKYYGEELNNYYNNWVKEHSIHESSIAYRSLKKEKGKSNIEHAAEVINRIYNLKSCYIMIGDFKGYFDNIDHQKLKDRMCKVLRIDENNLSKDWYKVFQSVTKYSYYNQKLIHKYCGTDKQLKQQKQFKYFSSPKYFREFKSLYPASINNLEVGIPQGTATSAVLSNVYAIDFDEQVNRMVHQYGGIYRRYSDDFIIVLPEDNVKDSRHFENFLKDIEEVVRVNGMIIESSKTKAFYYYKNQITDFYSSIPVRMDYLGFVFDGKTVEMRGKSPYKFYRHAKRLIEKAKKAKAKKKAKKLPYRKQIYSLYTDLGIDRRPYGNFITYAMKSQEAFDKISPYTNNLMMQQVYNRRRKIHKMIGYKISHHVTRKNGNGYFKY